MTTRRKGSRTKPTRTRVGHPVGLARATPPRRDLARLGGAFLALLVITLAIYHPAWHGGRLWDDDVHLTPLALQSLHGLWRIWFDPGATPQYYPVAHSAFWMMHRLWGDDTVGNHLVNIGLHATSAFLILLLLRRLAVPGAALVALVFAVHPIQVESVAWMTELKNTLSGVFFFAAALVYVSFDTTRRGRAYAIAFALFCFALLTKSVTASLPAALLVVFWWQRGRLRWKEDVRPLVPFLVVGFVSGVATAWIERTQIGAEGAAFRIPAIDRCLIAGRALLFYVWKLVWPTHLIFTYPRWNVSPAVWWQDLCPVAVVGILAGLYAWRRRSRAPLAAALLFVGILFPALGFVNVYPFIFSFVADHFQYLANVPLVALGSAALVILGRRWWPQLSLNLTEGLPAIEVAILVVVGLPLAVLAWQQSKQYADAETLYRTTLSENPSCWLAYNNLGFTLMTSARIPAASVAGPVAARITPDQNQAIHEAIEDFTQALRLNPSQSQAENNLGTAYLALGELPAAREAFQAALRLKPTDADVHYNLGITLSRMGQRPDALTELRESLRLDPSRASAHAEVASALLADGDLPDAIAEYRQSLQLDSTNAEAHDGLGTALGRTGQVDEAIAEYEAAVQLDAQNAPANTNLGVALLRAGHLQEATDRFQTAVRIDPTFARAHYGLANALEAQGRHEEAVAEFRQTLKYQPTLAEAHNDLGIALAELGRSQEAAGEFREALRLKPDLADARANLARALGGG